ncbi:MAG: GNAT family N-acetyltransferase, partial [Thermoplasmata archaeon]|nr:GNAT family N-acetyltransferase [Thermoplasmata archaeon]
MSILAIQSISCENIAPLLWTRGYWRFQPILASRRWPFSTAISPWLRTTVHLLVSSWSPPKVSTKRARGLMLRLSPSHSRPKPVPLLRKSAPRSVTKVGEDAFPRTSRRGSVTQPPSSGAIISTHGACPRAGARSSIGTMRAARTMRAALRVPRLLANAILSRKTSKPDAIYIGFGSGYLVPTWTENHSERFIPGYDVTPHVTPAPGTDPPREGDIVPATPKDVKAIIRLVEEAGWAYTRAEVERLIAVQPGGMLLKRSTGFRHEVLGCVYASVWGRLGFIGLMLVKESLRGQGMGQELMAAGMAHIRSLGISSVGLDSVGNVVSFYSDLGFKADWTSLRFGLETARFDLPEAPPEVRRGGDIDLSRAIELDRTMSGLDRDGLLRRLHADGDSTLLVVPTEKAVLAY